MNKMDSLMILYKTEVSKETHNWENLLEINRKLYAEAYGIYERLFNLKGKEIKYREGKLPGYDDNSHLLKKIDIEIEKTTKLLNGLCEQGVMFSFNIPQLNQGEDK